MKMVLHSLDIKCFNRIKILYISCCCILLNYWIFSQKQKQYRWQSGPPTTRMRMRRKSKMKESKLEVRWKPPLRSTWSANNTKLSAAINHSDLVIVALCCFFLHIIIFRFAFLQLGSCIWSDLITLAYHAVLCYELLLITCILTQRFKYVIK